jgi:hypothetical protein
MGADTAQRRGLDGYVDEGSGIRLEVRVLARFGNDVEDELAGVQPRLEGNDAARGGLSRRNSAFFTSP